MVPFPAMKAAVLGRAGAGIAADSLRRPGLGAAAQFLAKHLGVALSQG